MGNGIAHHFRVRRKQEFTIAERNKRLEYAMIYTRPNTYFDQNISTDNSMLMLSKINIHG